MGIANFPFPSFTFVLMSDRVIIPGPSYVIRLAPLVVLQPHSPQTTVLTTNIANEDIGEEDNSLFENDSIRDVAVGHFDAEELEYDVTETTYESLTAHTTLKGQDEVGTKKMRRFRFKSIFKRLTRFTYSN